MASHASLLLRRWTDVQQAAIKVTISAGVPEKRKDRTWKNRSEEKMEGFSSASLFPARKQEAVTHGGTRNIDHLTRRRNKGAGIVKGWEDNRGRGRIPDTFM